MHLSPNEGIAAQERYKQALVGRVVNEQVEVDALKDEGAMDAEHVGQMQEKADAAVQGNVLGKVIGWIRGEK